MYNLMKSFILSSKIKFLKGCHTTPASLCIEIENNVSTQN